MASIAISLDKRYSGVDKNVRIRVTSCGKSAYVSTGVKIESRYFTANTQHPVSDYCPNAQLYNDTIMIRVRHLERAINQLTLEGCIDNMSGKEIKEYTFGYRERVVKPKVVSFTEFFYEFGSKRRADLTVNSYMYVYRMIMKFATEEKHRKTLYFRDITFKFLKDLEDWMFETGKGDSTRHMTFSYIRSCLNEAMRLKLAPRDANPFLDFQIKEPMLPDEIECIEPEDMRVLMELDMGNIPNSCLLERARDILLISFYLCGMNLKDIYELPRMEGDSVDRVRSKVSSKTKRQMHIPISPELQVLIDKYPGKTHMFNFCEKHICYETFRSKINERLKMLSNITGRKYTMALVRHSWATYATDIDIPDAVIDMSMGHMPNKILRRRYSRFDWDKTGDAIRKINEYVMSTPPQNYTIHYKEGAGYALARA